MISKTNEEIFNILNKNIPNPQTELIYSSNFELLVAVMLSAQCTDKRVNQVTKVLFKNYNKPEHFAKMKQAELEKLIHSCGFYHNKAKNIIAMSNELISKFNGQVPENFNDLCSLSGVGRKTANVMLIVAFNVPAMPVDTHIFRVSNRLGIANSNNVNVVEAQIKKAYKDYSSSWGKLHHLLLLHGRYVCKAQTPNCAECYLAKYCKYYNKKLKG